MDYYSRYFFGWDNPRYPINVCILLPLEAPIKEIRFILGNKLYGLHLSAEPDPANNIHNDNVKQLKKDIKKYGLP